MLTKDKVDDPSKNVDDGHDEPFVLVRQNLPRNNRGDTSEADSVEYVTENDTNCRELADEGLQTANVVTSFDDVDGTTCQRKRKSHSNSGDDEQQDSSAP